MFKKILYKSVESSMKDYSEKQKDFVKKVCWKTFRFLSVVGRGLIFFYFFIMIVFPVLGFEKTLITLFIVQNTLIWSNLTKSG